MRRRTEPIDAIRTEDDPPRLRKLAGLRIAGQDATTAPHAGAQGARADVHCPDATRRRLLLAYSVDRVNEFERHAFESHLFSCDTCYEDLLAIWRVSALLDEWDGTDTDCGGSLVELVRESRRARVFEITAVALLAAGVGCVLGLLLHVF